MEIYERNFSIFVCIVDIILENADAFIFMEQVALTTTAIFLCVLCFNVNTSDIYKTMFNVTVM